jgi:hypothetical protein
MKCDPGTRLTCKLGLAHWIGAVTLTALAAGCCFLARQAPERAFTPEDLLVDPVYLPTQWESSGVYLPAGDDMATSESATVQYRTPGSDVQVEATNDVFRYQSVVFAESRFNNVYLAKVRYLEPVAQWTHEVASADQEHFGCYEWADPTGLVCQWGARYEEYIVLFRTRIVPGEMSLADMWDVVQGVDAKIASYLE